MSSNKTAKTLKNNPLIQVIGVQKIVVLTVLICLFVFFCIVSPAFRQYSTILSIMDYTYYIAFMGIGVTFVLITGGVDLSIGTGVICYGLIGGYMVTHNGVPVIGGILITLLIGILFGLANGVLVAGLNMPPFLVTLCTMMLARGVGSIATNGMSVTWPVASAAEGWFRSIFKVSIGGIKFPIGFLLVIICIIVMSIVLNKTKVGRYIIAIGSNKEATRLSGVNVVKYQIIAYVISGFFTGIAAIAYAATFQAIAPGTGAGMELDAIGGVIIGGTSTSGGAGSVSSTLLGVFIMSILKTGLPYIGLQANYQQIITGMVLVVAVAIDVAKNRRIN